MTSLGAYVEKKQWKTDLFAQLLIFFQNLAELIIRIAIL